MNEIEIRGVLSREEFDRVKDFLEKNGKFEKSFKRLSVEISPKFNTQTRKWEDTGINLRIKKSDDEEKISLKYGDPLHHTLEEYEIIINPGQTEVALQFFSKLGFSEGLIYFWESWVYEYLGMEIKISQYTEDYYMWEIEYRGDSPEEAEQKVYSLAKELKIKPLTREEYRKEIDYQCQNIFELYTLENFNRALKKFS